MRTFEGELPLIIRRLGAGFVYFSERVDVGEWQAMDISDKPQLVTHEIRHVTFQCPMSNDPRIVAEMTGANLPWAEDHFLERVSGEPLNPAPSHEWWPYRQRGNEDHIQNGVFSHTYPERYWPKQANTWPGSVDRMGIRYCYGDLLDVVHLLDRNLLTRQAYLPVWFPEDTGAVDHQRVPCSLGYHFLVRNGQLDIDYHIRSCDFLRHFRDDVYMTMRLAQWVGDKVQTGVGDLVMHIGSLHVFDGDMPNMRRMYGS